MTFSSTPEVDAALLRSLLEPAERAGLTMRDRWQTLRRRAQLQRVVPLLYHLVDDTPTDLDDDQREELLQLQGDAMAWVVRVEHHLLDAADVLRRAGTPFTVLKGAATAHLDYPDPTWRYFGDADVLVGPDAFHDACSALIVEGWAQAYTLPKHHEEFTHAVTLTRGGVELDLHQRLGHRAIGRLIPASSVLDDRVPLEIAGAQLHAPSPAHRLIHAAVHSVTSRGNTKRLSSVADVLLLAHRSQRTAAETLDAAGSWGIRSLVERAVTEAYTVASTQISEPWRMALDNPPRRRSSMVERTYVSQTRHPILEELAYLRLLGWAERSRYLRGHLHPGKAYLAANSRSGARSHVTYLRSKLSRSGGAEPLPLALRQTSGEEASHGSADVFRGRS